MITRDALLVLIVDTDGYAGENKATMAYLIANSRDWGAIYCPTRAAGDNRGPACGYVTHACSLMSADIEA